LTRDRTDLGEDQSALIQLIQEVLNRQEPKTTRELVHLVSSKDPTRSEASIIATIEYLRTNNGISLRYPKTGSFARFFINLKWNSFFWVVIGFSLAYAILYSVPANFPWNLPRLFVGATLLFYFPGRNLRQGFLSKIPLQALERVLLEIAMSIILVIMTGLVLNFSASGLLSTPALGGIIGLNFSLAIIASNGEYRSQR